MFACVSIFMETPPTIAENKLSERNKIVDVSASRFAERVRVNQAQLTSNLVNERTDVYRTMSVPRAGPHLQPFSFTSGMMQAHFMTVREGSQSHFRGKNSVPSLSSARL